MFEELRPPQLELLFQNTAVFGFFALATRVGHLEPFLFVEVVPVDRPDQQREAVGQRRIERGAEDELELALARPLEIAVGPASRIADILEKSESTQRVLEEATEGFRLQLVQEAEDGEEVLSIDRITADSSPIIRLVDSVLFNAGRGSNFTTDGVVSMDASIMIGDSRATINEVLAQDPAWEGKTIDEALTLMGHYKISGVPITEGKKLDEWIVVPSTIMVADDVTDEYLAGRDIKLD